MVHLWASVSSCGNGPLELLGQRASARASFEQSHAESLTLDCADPGVVQKGRVRIQLLYFYIFSKSPCRLPSLLTRRPYCSFIGLMLFAADTRDYDDDYYDDDDDRPRRRRGRADDLHMDAEPVPSGWDASGWFSGAQQANQGGLFEWARRCGWRCSFGGGRGLMNPVLDFLWSLVFCYKCVQTCACVSRRRCIHLRAHTWVKNARRTARGRVSSDEDDFFSLSCFARMVLVGRASRLYCCRGIRCCVCCSGTIIAQLPLVHARK